MILRLSAWINMKASLSSSLDDDFIPSFQLMGTKEFCQPSPASENLFVVRDIRDNGIACAEVNF